MYRSVAIKYFLITQTCDHLFPLKYIVCIDIYYGVPFYIYLNNCIDHIIIYRTKECLNYTSFCGLHLPFASSCVTHPPKGSVYKWVRRKKRFITDSNIYDLAYVRACY